MCNKVVLEGDVDVLLSTKQHSSTAFAVCPLRNGSGNSGALMTHQGLGEPVTFFSNGWNGDWTIDCRKNFDAPVGTQKDSILNPYRLVDSGLREGKQATAASPTWRTWRTLSRTW